MSIWLDNASKEAVDRFWQLCGETELFPRNLERSVALALPLSVIKLPRLKLNHIENWLAQHCVNFSFGCTTRAVRGCLVAFKGDGLIFLDGTDAEEEQRMTLAHEIGHFMMDYLWPRQKAIQKLGGRITEVLDGLRRPILTERVDSLLAETATTVFTKLVERDNTTAEYESVWIIEDRADRVALALLAPPEVVLNMADVSAESFEKREEELTTMLKTQFGLPVPAAIAYAKQLLNSIGRGPSWTERFRLSRL